MNKNKQEATNTIIELLEAVLFENEKVGFEVLEIVEILKGIKNGVNVSVYAEPKFSPPQMQEIRLGLEAG